MKKSFGWRVVVTLQGDSALYEPLHFFVRQYHFGIIFQVGSKLGSPCSIRGFQSFPPPSHTHTAKAKSPVEFSGGEKRKRTLTDTTDQLSSPLRTLNRNVILCTGGVSTVDTGETVNYGECESAAAYVAEFKFGLVRGRGRRQSAEVTERKLRACATAREP